MLTFSCFNCGRMLTISDEEIVTVISDETARRVKHHTILCPHCRRVNKIPMKRIRTRYQLLQRAGAIPEAVSAGSTDPTPEQQAELEQEATDSAESASTPQEPDTA